MGSAWLDIIPPKHMTEGNRRASSESGDLLVITADEARQLDQIEGRLPHSPHPADDFRMAVCRTLGHQRVAVVLSNAERGLSTPVKVE